jgi:alpha-L-fucosidase
MIHRTVIARTFLTLLPIASFGLATVAATTSGAPIPAGTMRALQGAQPIAFGGGTLEPPRDFMTDAQRQAIQDEINANVERLRLSGKLAPTAIAAHPLFSWPLRMAAGVSDPGYHGISNFVDLDLNYPGFLLDYNCGQRTYDTADGNNHAGTDFFIWPWSWRKMDRKEIQIVAAAPGQIIYRADGNFDRSCANNSNPWNAVYVQHADGSIAFYGHMKSGSVTPKQVGDFVATGEFLGNVGSSGSSTGPHLHFEVHNALGQVIEPWAGSCNTLTTDSWWSSQRPYYDSAVDRLTTGDAQVDLGFCPADESPHARVSFDPGTTVYFTAYYRDQLNTQVSTYTVYRPDGSTFSQWTHQTTAAYYDGSYWVFLVSIPSQEMQGTWRFTVDYESTTLERQFTVGSPAACGSVPQTAAQGALLQVQRISTSLKLSWGASCNPQDTDYVIYEGAIGDFANYSPFRCTTSGSLAAVFLPAAGSRFYLVGPRNATREGSLGTFDDGTERPAGLSSCTTRLALPCP